MINYLNATARLAMAAVLGLSMGASPVSAEVSAPSVLTAMPVAAGLGPVREILGLGKKNKGEKAPSVSQAGGGFSKATMNIGGLQREYYFYVPSSGGSGKPLVLGFHGGGGKAQEFGSRMGFTDMAEKYGYVVVLPQGVGRKKGGTWNAESVTGLDYAEKNNIDDVAFVKAVLDQMKSVTSYNPSKVYAAGLSKGGMMAYHFACEAQERVSAIAAVASTFSSRSCSGGDVSLLHIHGTKDENVPWDGGAGQLSRKGANWPEVPRGISVFSDANSCSTSLSTSKPASDTTCEVRQCSGGDVIEVCKVSGGGHAWPGATPASWQKKHGVYVSPHFDATDYIGAFFAKH